MFIREAAATRGERRRFSAAARRLMYSDMFVDVLHETNKYVWIHERPAGVDPPFFEQNPRLFPPRPLTNVALILLTTDTTVGDSRESADPIFPVR
jgi:hypothetical protein